MESSRIQRRLSVGLVLVLAAGTAFASQKKEKKELERTLTDEQFEAQIEAYEQSVDDDQKVLAELSLLRLDREYAEHQKSGKPFVQDVLIISGGGAKGAFGAGFLQAWGEIEPGPMARPEFDVVTGVSTGALIAPFAFVGTDKSYADVAEFYANPQENWIKKRGKLYLLPGHISLFNDLALQDYIRATMNDSIIRQVAEGSAEGRILLIGATNLDLGLGREFEIGIEARKAQESGDLDRIHRILLASSALPGLFPPVEIDGFYYVDGGVAEQIFSILALHYTRSPLPRWQERNPDSSLPKYRLWVIVNENLRMPPAITHRKWGTIFKRSIETMMHSSMLAALRNIQQLAENSRNSLGLDVEFRYVSIPQDASLPPQDTMFDKDFMVALEALGREFGKDPSSWETAIPEIHWLDKY
jgi:predicted acylesterase/phospholipase RssA